MTRQQHKFLVRNPKLLVALNLAERLSRLLAWLPRRRPGAGAPRRILVSNIAHIGDILLSSALLPPLRRAFPDAEIDLLVGTWNRHVVDGHPDVTHVHVFDNARVNRARAPMRAKLVRHLRTWGAAWRAIRARRYDVAIDVYPFWPNSIPLLWAAGIPRRIGFDSGGFGPLLTDAQPWIDSDRHMIVAQADLLRRLGVDVDSQPLVQSLPPLPSGRPGPLVDHGVVGDYVVLHPGTGSPCKEWPLDHWIAFTGELAARGWTLVLTGQGAREAAAIAAIVAAVPQAHDLCDRLSWGQLRQVIAGARLLVGVDSMAGHLAAADGTPLVVINGGTVRLAWWRPLAGQVLAASLECAPCLRPSGCATMDCLRSITPAMVLAACADTLGGGGPHTDHG